MGMEEWQKRGVKEVTTCKLSRLEKWIDEEKEGQEMGSELIQQRVTVRVGEERRGEGDSVNCLASISAGLTVSC